MLSEADASVVPTSRILTEEVKELAQGCATSKVLSWDFSPTSLMLKPYS